MGHIICIGQSALDFTTALSHPIIENQKYRITDIVESGGGPAFNASYLCGMWGAEVSLVSRIGEDENGKKLRQMAESVHVNLDMLIPDLEYKTAYSYIFTNTKNGSRTLFNFPGKASNVNYTFPEKEVSVILSDGHEPEMTAEAIKKYPHAISIADAGSYRESTMQVAKMVDYLVCSEDFARQYTGKDLVIDHWQQCVEVFEQIEKINHKHVVITLGESGLLYRDHGNIVHFPAYRVKAIDTNGAGDIFHGAFAYGMSHQMPLIDILKMSSMASAISVQYPGSQSAIPTLDMLEKGLLQAGEQISIK